MSDAKFTKNDWEIAEGGVFVYALNESGVNAFSLLLEGNAKKGAGLEELQANAQLIAAAPELYENLSKLVAWADGSSKDAYGDLESARKVLAKARGE